MYDDVMEQIGGTEKPDQGAAANAPEQGAAGPLHEAPARKGMYEYGDAFQKKYGKT
jgi:hypothetical protein